MSCAKPRDNVRYAIVWLVDNRCDGKQTEFANRVDVTRQKVNNWVKGFCAPDLDVVAEISKEFEVSLDWIIGGDIEKAPSDYMCSYVKLDGEEDD